jgi:hypothetical protein
MTHSRTQGYVTGFNLTGEKKPDMLSHIRSKNIT